MEVLGLVDLPLWLVCILSTLISLYMYTSYKQNYFRRLGIPTKPTVPMLGDFMEIASKGFRYVDAEMVQKNGKLFGLFLGNFPELMISDPEMIKQITVKEFSKFTDRARLLPLGKKWESAVNVAEGAHWKFLRSTLSPTFSSGKMRSMTGMINKCIDTLKENLKEQEGTDFDIVPQFKGFTMDVICSTGFGLEVNSQKEHDSSPFLKYAKEFFEFDPAKNPVFMLGLFFPNVLSLMSKFGLKTRLLSEEGMNFFDSATKSAFSDRRKSDSRYRDLLQTMIDAQKRHKVNGDEAENGVGETLQEFKDRGMTDEEILINSLIFMVAGFDTTASTLMWLTYLLAVNPEVQEKLITEVDEAVGKTKPSYDNVFKLKYLDMVVNETLRMYPIASRINRQPAEDVMICGKLLPKGLDCTVPVSAIHHLPEYWPNPEKFDPERFSPENEGNIVPYTYLPFGSGPRNCIGMRLAQLEMKMAIVGILQTYRLSPSPKLEIPPPMSKVGLTKPKNPVLLRLSPRVGAM